MTEPAAEENNGGMRATITLAATIVGAFVGINSIVTSCSTHQASQLLAYQQFVANEQRFWQELDNDLAVIEAEREQSGVPTAEEAQDGGLPGSDRLAAIEFLAYHRQYDDEQYRHLSNYEVSNRVEIAAIRSRILGKLGEPRLVGFDEREDISAARFDDYSDWSRRRDNEGILDDSRDSRDVLLAHEYRPPPRPNIVQLTVAQAGTRGWDLDILWCHNERATDNLAAATYMAAQAVRRGEPLGFAGRPLGRVRIRLLPEDQRKLWLPENGGEFYVWSVSDDVTRESSMARQNLSEHVATEVVSQWAKLRAGRFDGAVTLAWERGQRPVLDDITRHIRWQALVFVCSSPRAAARKTLPMPA